MTVTELIEKLKQYDKDAKVYLLTDTYTEISDIEDYDNYIALVAGDMINNY